jgi:hypothetical protein
VFLDREVVMDKLRINYPFMLFAWLAVAAVASFVAIAHALLESHVTMN